MFQVAAHEFGHALGLSHSNVNSALMWAFYEYKPDFELAYDDIAAIQVGYHDRQTTLIYTLAKHPSDSSRAYFLK